MASGVAASLLLLDLLVAAALTWLAMQTLRRPAKVPAQMPRLLSAAAAALLLLALLFGWVKLEGAGTEVEGLTTPMWSSAIAAAALLFSALVLGLRATWSAAEERPSVSVLLMVLGGVWLLVSLNGLLLAADVNRSADPGAEVIPGPALWACLGAGALTVASAAVAVRWGGQASDKSANRAWDRGSVDDWDAGAPLSHWDHEAGDEW